jgi:effector-binding domain-containing protein
MSDLLDLPPFDPVVFADTEPELVHLEPRDTAIIVTETPVERLPQAIADALPAVEGAVTAAGVALTSPPFVRYLSMGPELRAEIGFTIGTAIAPVGRVKPGRLPGGDAARILHLGSYDTIAASYERLMAWIAAGGRTAAGPFWEVYWTDPSMNPDPATWRTEVVAPVGPSGR